MNHIEELKFCLDLWEKKGYCGFGGKTECDKCAAPYLLYKMITGKALHDSEMERLKLSNWKELIKDIK